MNKQSILYKLETLFLCKEVGSDSFGNKYYESIKQDRVFNRRSRRVIYTSLVEASLVPPVWNAWLTFQIEHIPLNENIGYRWEKPHMPNLTGTKYAYFPYGHLNMDHNITTNLQHYESWKPTS